MGDVARHHADHAFHFRQERVVSGASRLAEYFACIAPSSRFSDERVGDELVQVTSPRDGVFLGQRAIVEAMLVDAIGEQRHEIRAARECMPQADHVP